MNRTRKDRIRLVSIFPSLNISFESRSSSSSLLIFILIIRVDHCPSTLAFRGCRSGNSLVLTCCINVHPVCFILNIIVHLPCRSGCTVIIVAVTLHHNLATLELVGLLLGRLLRQSSLLWLGLLLVAVSTTSLVIPSSGFSSALFIICDTVLILLLPLSTSATSTRLLLPLDLVARL